MRHDWFGSTLDPLRWSGPERLYAIRVGYALGAALLAPAFAGLWRSPDMLVLFSAGAAVSFALAGVLLLLHGPPEGRGGQAAAAALMIMGSAGCVGAAMLPPATQEPRMIAAFIMAITLTPVGLWRVCILAATRWPALATALRLNMLAVASAACLTVFAATIVATLLDNAERAQALADAPPTTPADAFDPQLHANAYGEVAIDGVVSWDEARRWRSRRHERGGRWWWTAPVRSARNRRPVMFVYWPNDSRIRRRQNEATAALEAWRAELRERGGAVVIRGRLTRGPWNWASRFQQEAERLGLSEAVLIHVFTQPRAVELAPRPLFGLNILFLVGGLALAAAAALAPLSRGDALKAD